MGFVLNPKQSLSGVWVMSDFNVEKVGDLHVCPFMTGAIASTCYQLDTENCILMTQERTEYRRINKTPSLAAFYQCSILRKLRILQIEFLSWLEFYGAIYKTILNDSKTSVSESTSNGPSTM